MGAGVVMMAGGIVGMVVCMILFVYSDQGFLKNREKSCSVKLKMRFSSRERTSVYEK